MTCGDWGGVTAKGEPCRRAAGWGVPGTDEGRCKTHLEQVPEPQTVTAPTGYAFVVRLDRGTMERAFEVTLSPFLVKQEEPEEPPPDPEPQPEPEPPPVPTGAIEVEVVRFRPGLVSSGLPFAPGVLADPALVRVLTLAGVELAAFVRRLEGNHPDGSGRSALIQFETSEPRVRIVYGEPRTKQRAEVPVSHSFDQPLPAAVLSPSRDYLLASGIVMPTTPAPDPFSDRYESRFVTQSDGRYAQLLQDWPTLNGDQVIGRNYYDRALIHWAWWVRTGEPKYWERAARYLMAWREKYVRGYNYRVQPHQMMPEGLELHYLLTGDPESRRGVGEMAAMLNVSAWMNDYGGKLDWGGTEGRIQSRILLAFITATRLGFDYRAQAGTMIGHMAGLQNAQGFWPYTATCGGSLNYMAALQLEVAIKYWTYIDRDPRILPMAQKLGEWLWSTQWRGDGSFNYNSVPCSGVGGPDAAHDLNMLFTPMFGWLYQQTGDAKWRTRGDQIFAEGASKAWFGSNFLQADKQFNEHYRSSWQYLTSRS